MAPAPLDDDAAQEQQNRLLGEGYSQEQADDGLILRPPPDPEPTLEPEPLPEVTQQEVLVEEPVTAPLPISHPQSRCSVPWNRRS